jgi:hypothetical protein
VRQIGIVGGGGRRDARSETEGNGDTLARRNRMLAHGSRKASAI